MRYQNIKTAPEPIQAAFREVQAVFSNLDHVTYLEDLRWRYTLADGECPAFPKGLIDVDLLEKAADSLTEVPVTYSL